ncbi:MAG: dockerin type I repeat-containing protein [candidate division Zixibacteria bacterium]|nr:dockerin type I repeat-containing protein [candidate division Zixibacteria bacterium]
MIIRQASAVFIARILISIMALTAFACFAAFAADKPLAKVVDKTAIPIRLAPVYGFGEVEAGVAPAGKAGTPMALGIIGTNAFGTQIGVTTYDLQHNCSMGRQVEHRGTGFVNLAWTIKTDSALDGPRGIAYTVYDLSECEMVFSPSHWITGGYAGYAAVDADQLGRAMIAENQRIDADPFSSRVYWDTGSNAPTGDFVFDGPTDSFGWYQNDGLGPTNPNLWPKIEWQVGTETVLHMVAAESGWTGGSPLTISYYRRVGGYGAGVGVWSPQRIIDTVVNINPVVVASPNSDKVAIVWNAPVDYRRDTPQEFGNQYENDIWYAISGSQGGDWISGIGNGSIGHEVIMGTLSGENVTRYAPSSDYKAFCDIAALIDGSDNLHIVWGCRRWVDTTALLRRKSAIFHWSEEAPVARPIIKANWDTGGNCSVPTWGSDVAKMSISECQGKLYVLYSQFGNGANPCYDMDAATRILNGELYMTASDDGGLSWDGPQNLTNSVTADCAPGDCESDYWASMARYGRTEVCGDLAGWHVLDVLYINDRSAGSAVQDTPGMWTANPVMWLRTPCRPVVQEPFYVDDADEDLCGYPYDMFLVPYQGKDTVYFTMENPGTADNHFNISVVYNQGDGWLEVTPTAGTIPSGINNKVTVRVIASDPRTDLYGPNFWEGSLMIAHEAAGSPRNMSVCLEALEGPPDPDATLATACSRIRVFGSGRLVNITRDASFDFIDDCDTFSTQTDSRMYLFDGSPVICRMNPSDPSDTMRFMMEFSNNIYDDGALRPDGDAFAVDSTGNPGYTLATARFRTADETIGMTAEYYVPKSADSCNFLIQKYRLYNLTETPLTGVYVGEILDWDIPSDSMVNNGSGYDESMGVIYQFGGEYNQDDSTEAFCPQESSDRYGAIARLEPGRTFRNAMTLDNATYVYSSGPYGSQAPFPPGAIYRLMKEKVGYSLFQSPDPDSQYVDLSMLVTFGSYNLHPGDTHNIAVVLVNSKTGLGYLTGQVEKARAFADDYDIVSACCLHPGDANGDGQINVGDAVFIVNYIFRSGPAPNCPQEANTNGDGKITVGDAVYIISYIFRGGPAPVCGP